VQRLRDYKKCYDSERFKEILSIDKKYRAKRCLLMERTTRRKMFPLKQKKLLKNGKKSFKMSSDSE
jgi:hypothetical protein